MRKLVFVTASLLLLTSCSTPVVDPDEVVHKMSKQPRFMKYADRMKQRSEEKHVAFVKPKAHGNLGNETIFFMGTNPLFDEILLNEGPPSEGIKITVSGDALSKLVDLKRPVDVWAYDRLDKRPTQRVQAPFVSTAENVYVAIIPDIRFDNAIEVAFKADLWKFDGSGKLQIAVQPIAGDVPTVWANEITVAKTEY